MSGVERARQGSDIVIRRREHLNIKIANKLSGSRDWVAARGRNRTARVHQVIRLNRCCGEGWITRTFVKMATAIFRKGYEPATSQRILP